MLSAGEARRLRARWNPHQIRECSALLAKRKWDPTAFPFQPLEIAGQSYVDFRGFKPTKPILRLKAERLAFSYAYFSPIAGIGLAQLKHCLFIGCRYEAALSTTFVECDFSNSDLRRVTLGPGTSFTNCSFEGANISGADSLDATFLNCTFRRACFVGGKFVDCLFDRCAFSEATFGAGELTGSRFRNMTDSFTWIDGDTGSRMQALADRAKSDVDLEDTCMDGVQFE